MAGIAFPALVPTQRSYNPGVFPDVLFTAQNGAVTRMRYGNQRSSSELTLNFDNISDYNASLILIHYTAVMGTDDYAIFTASNVAAGVSADLVPWITETNSALRWKYKQAPVVQSVTLGLSAVDCAFVGELRGI
jgi:hypothetical protein